MPTGLKHLIQCRCILPQFKRSPNPPFHKFIVFSVINDDGNVVPKLVSCNSCGVVHRVTDITKSTIVSGKEDTSAAINIDDMKCCLPQNLATMLESNNVDIPTWEAVKFFYENKQWGQFVVLSSESTDGERAGKYVQLLGENLFKVEPFVRQEVVS